MEDKRRTLGVETKQRLIEAMAEALSRSGPAAVSMRAVTAAAGVNVAAVKYHFGSRESLIDAVLADATARIASEQDRRLSALEARSEDGDEISVREWIEAWGGPIVAVALSDAREERRLGRIISNAVNEQSPLGPSLNAIVSRADRRLVRGLSGLLHADEADLRFRLTVMVAVLVSLASGSFQRQLNSLAARTSADARLFDILEAIIRSGATAP